VLIKGRGSELRENGGWAGEHGAIRHDGVTGTAAAAVGGTLRRWKSCRSPATPVVGEYGAVGEIEIRQVFELERSDASN
jgi:hypothetical protein